MRNALTCILLALFAGIGAGSASAAGCGMQNDVPEAERLGHRLRWETRSEVESAGFDIFRSEKEDGGFVKINAEPLPAAKYSLRKRQYEYTDYAIDPCLTYHYYVDVVSTSGERSRVSLTLTAKPKRSPDGDKAGGRP